MSIKVKPGTARVPKGSDQDILATLVNFDSQQVTIFARPLGSKDDFQGTGDGTRESESDFRFRSSTFRIRWSTSSSRNNVRSEVYKLNVVDLPYVKQLDLTLNFPAFTNLPTKAIEDGGDIAALKGTVATITAKLSGKVRAARIVFPTARRRDEAAGLRLRRPVNRRWRHELLHRTRQRRRRSVSRFERVRRFSARRSTAGDLVRQTRRDKKATNLEEVFTQARAEDDYGVVSMDLHFSVNGGEEKTVNLQQLTRESARSLTGAYTFFLEEYNLKPGDFISYFAKARDASNEATSDIYFIEVKPFEMEYKQSQQQGGGGGGQGGDQDQNALSRGKKI